MPQDIFDVADLQADNGQGLAVQVLTNPSQNGGAGTFFGAGGDGTYFWVDPGLDLTGLLMLQLNPVPEALHQQFRMLTYRAFSIA